MSGGRPVRYPWTEWTDGQVRDVVQGTDFDTSMDIMRGNLHRKARDLGMHVQTKDMSRTVIRFQFTERPWWDPGSWQYRKVRRGKEKIMATRDMTLSQLLSELKTAMVIEDVDVIKRHRVMNRIMYGHPDGLNARIEVKGEDHDGTEGTGSALPGPERV